MTDFSGVVDELYNPRNLLYTGAYQQVINALNSLQITNPSNSIEKDILLYRAYILQGKAEKVLNDISAGTDSVLLRAVRALALCSLNQKEQGLEGINSLIELGSPDISSPTFALLASLVYISNEANEEAVKLLIPHETNLECSALLIQTYLLLNRGDLAKQALQQRGRNFDDALLIQLAEAWVKLKTDGSESAANSAYFIFDEVARSTSMSTVTLLNSMAVAKLHQGQYPEAKTYLLEALEKDENNPETLANLVVHANVTGTGLEDMVEYSVKLETVAPKHPFLVDIREKDSQFDQLAAELSG
ncbi:hypothetical protein H4219_000884 [Mycoemilia scoparia]|uniref:Coatomer subunit epsilon n=1 Tax=Mycoemilia scoparia TaxID=417184 RepID=A0A9W8DSG9_9FUNG|nr:hypothetical protein H4219_000884 [Mycoemilia scoparia]